MLPFVWQLKKDKLTNYIVSTNDSKFDDVKTIIGDDYQDGKPYLITNNPVSDNNYIQGGARHTVLGMEYGNKSYGQQTSFSLAGIRYRSEFAGVWEDWQCLTQNITTGTEFETGRIIDDKKEYGIIVDCGSLPNNTSKSKSLPITLSQVNITKIETLCKSGSGVIQNFEFYSGFNGLYLSTSQNVVTFATKADGSAYNLLVTLYYTKN